MARKRSLRPDFCDYVAMNPHIWPLEAAVKRWCEEQGIGGFRNGACSSLPNGRPQNPRIITLIVTYLMQSNPNTVVRTQLAGLYDFLRTYRNDPDPSALRPLQIVERICEPPLSTKDYVMMGLDLIGSAFTLFTNPTNGIRPCRESELGTVLPWLYIDLGHAISPSITSAGIAKECAAAHIGITPETLHEQVRVWMRRAPWSVVVADGPNGPDAVSIAVPLSAVAYEQIRAGRLRLYDCSSDHVRARSKQIFVEALAMKPRSDGKPIAGTNAPLARAVICQHAHLTDIDGIGRKRTLRLLTCPVADRFRQWALRFRYRPIGVPMHGTELELFERQVRIRLSDVQTWSDIPHLAVWRQLQRLMRSRAQGITGR